MKIVILDGYTLNPGDLNWSALEALGECTIYDRTPKDQIVERAEHADVVLTNKTPLRKDELQAFTNLRYIGVLATGYDVVDVEQARMQGITVTNIPAYGTNSVAQAVFALLLELTNHIGLHDVAVHQGDWITSPDWCFWRKPMIELSGKALGIIGYGRIGSKVAEIAQAFGMTVLVHTRTRLTDLPAGREWKPLEELLAASDVLSLHCPLRPETRGLINAERIALMKPTALLINTSRGPLIVEEDLAVALNSGHIAGAALDVLSTEPPAATNPLLTAANCILTPHVAWATFEARSRLLDVAVTNLKHWIEGSPANVIS